MVVDALATQPHYEDHIRPVWDALGPQQGTFRTGLPALGTNPLLVAGFADVKRAGRRPVILMEHGVGQTYGRNHPSYAGGSQRDRVTLFLNPSERVAELNRSRYPGTAQAVIGVPLLDRWVGYRPANPEPVVALAWHWDGVSVAPEARSAFRHYKAALPALPFRLLGHGHPRAMRWLKPFYQEQGIECTESFDEVLERADVLVFDNTSAGFLFAALDRPVVVLDAPWYRRAWGGRFWEWADIGVRIAGPAALAHAIEQALTDSPERAARRAEIVAQILPPVDGRATARAVEAIGALALEVAA